MSHAHISANAYALIPQLILGVARSHIRTCTHAYPTIRYAELFTYLFSKEDANEPQDMHMLVFIKDHTKTQKVCGDA